MHSDTSRVSRLPYKIGILCFYQLINFIDNFQHLMDHWSISNVYALISPCCPFLAKIPTYIFPKKSAEPGQINQNHKTKLEGNILVPDNTVHMVTSKHNKTDLKTYF